ncbi:MAG: LysM peptidoglycan-binding domain-containing protein [Lachnospiraceae bacterium]|nr:LysM peptidoglycan-binding domain-containing protein [Lachnospiraceae bacterium]
MMRAQKDVTNMTERELHCYKRRLRRQRKFRRKIATALLTLCLVTVCAVSYHAVRISANEGEAMTFKYYTRITVQSGENLWNIADRYIDYEQYKDKNEYIAEVVHINHLDEDASVRVGQHITVPYYSDEFVK